jgi:flagellar protein FlaG
MVQNIRPPHSPYFPPRQLESDAKPVRTEDDKVESEPRTFPASASTREDLERAAVRVKEALRGTTSHLEIEIDHDLQKAVIKVFNGESGEVIRQIPAQELLELAKHLDASKGLLFRERA